MKFGKLFTFIVCICLGWHFISSGLVIIGLVFLSVAALIPAA